MSEWTVQGLHEYSSNVEVAVADWTPVAGRMDTGLRSIRIEPFAHSAFLLPEQARHLASVLMQAADVAEHADDSGTQS